MKHLFKKVAKSLYVLPAFVGMFYLCNCSKNSSQLLKSEEQEYISIIGTKKPEKGFVSKYIARTTHQKNDEKFNWKIINENIAKIQSTTNNTCEIMPLRLGRTYLTAVLSDNPNVATTIQISVVKPNPRHITIHGETTLYVNEDQTYTVQYEPEECIEGVDWSIESETGDKIAEINKSGVLSPYAVGNATVVATSKADKTIISTLDITINQERPTSMKIVGPNIITTTTPVNYVCKCEPTEATQDVTWSLSTDPKYTGRATISDDGTLTPISKGIICLIAQSNIKPELSSSLEIRIAENVYNVVLSNTIGQSYFFYGNPCVIEGDDYGATFKSTTHKITSGITVPTHSELKKKDLEVLILNGEKYIPLTDFSLVHNVLTIPHEAITGDIKINLLGAEISDFMSWEELKSISDEDIKTDDKQEAKKLFQVGDYKMVTHKGKDVSFARLIDFYHNQFTTSEGTKTFAPFTFEMYQSNEPFGKASKFDSQAFKDAPCYFHRSSLSNTLSTLSIDSLDSFVRDVEISVQNKKRDKTTAIMRYFIMSGLELTGNHPMDQADYYALEQGSQYIYYSDDYISYRNMWERIHLDRNNHFFIRSCATDESEYDPETPRIVWFYVVIIEKDKSKFSYVETTTKSYICPLFCI